MKIGLICSAFDFLHAGHVKALQDASGQCDLLYVGLHVDPSIERPGRKSKPTVPLSERFFQLEGLVGVSVDHIIPYQFENEIPNIVRLYDVNVVFMGEEYQNRDYTVKGMPGIDVVFLKRDHTISSSRIRYLLKDNK